MNSALDQGQRDSALRQTLTRLLAGRCLSSGEAMETFQHLASAQASTSLKSAVLTALIAKGIEAEELSAFARAMLAAARGPLRCSQEVLLDTCGTGGDGSGSFNISSTCALLVASMGIPVAKHGNRSVSSSSGSADFFEALQIPFQERPQDVRAALEQHGFAFLYAPHYHPSMAGLANVRRELGIPTVFNLLGPLVNPARPTHQLIGCTDRDKGALIAGALAKLDVHRAYVVSGFDGWDEATPTGRFQLFDVRAGQVQERSMGPEDFGVEPCSGEELRAGDANHNAELLLALFHGALGPLHETVVLNAALVLLLVDATSDPRQAARQAREGIESGAALEFYERLISNHSNTNA